MMEVLRTRNYIRKINKKVENDTIKAEEISALVTLIQTLRTNLDGITISFLNIGPLKVHCRGLQRALYYTTGWKDNKDLKDPAVQTGKILVMAEEIIANPRKAMGKYTFVKETEATAEELDKGILDLKKHLSDFLADLIKALIVLIEEIKARRAAA